MRRDPSGADNGAVRPGDAPRVLFLARNLVIGGAERAFLNYVNHARSITPLVVLLHRRGGLLPELSSSVELRSLDAPLLGGALSADVVEQLYGGSTAQLFIECRRLALTLDETGASIVSSFLMRSHLVALLVKRWLRPRVRIILNVHEHMSGSVDFLYPRRRDRAAMRWVTTHLFPTADRVVVVADELRRDLVENYGLSYERVRTVYNPLDIAHIAAQANEAGSRLSLFGEHDARPMVVAVGRLVRLKGYDLLLQAFALLRRKIDARLVLVGDGDERQSLGRMAERFGIAAHVRFAGWQGNPWAYLARADVLALTSHTEAFPSVISEALALGVPVVASECSAGVRECLADGSAGLLVPPGDVSRTAEALARVLCDGALRDRLRAEGKRRVAAFDLPNAVAAYESVLLETDRPTGDRSADR